MSITGSRLAFVCFRCRRDLARRALSLPQYSHPQPLDYRRLRHQSTATASRFDDNYNEQEQQTDQNPQQRSDPIVKRPKRDRKHRWFKPTPVAGLGVQTLGKPSEIILLPDRDRIIPESATGDDAPQQHLSEALEEEKIPAPWDQVREHIDQTRAGMKKQSGRLEEAEWQKLRSILRQQFTRPQLKRYLREALGPGVPESIDKLKRPKLAEFIMTSVWTYELPQSPSAVPGAKEKNGTVATQSSEISRLHRPDVDDMLLFRRDSSGILSAIAGDTGASLVLTDQQAIQVTGTPSDVNAALKRLQGLKIQVTEMSLTEFGEISSLDLDAKAYKKLTELIGAKASIIMRHISSDMVTIKHFQADKQALQRARIQLRLQLEALVNFQQPSYNGTASVKRVKLGPYYPFAPESWVTDNQRWLRAFDAAVDTSEGSKVEKKSPSSELDNAWAKLQADLHHPMLLEDRTKFNGRRMELSTRIGMNLHQTRRMPKSVGISHEQPSSSFADEVPLLAQLLTSAKIRKHHEQVDEGDVPFSSPLLARVMLKPANLVTIAPTFEIHLYGADKSLGLRQGLNVARITAILDDKILNTSLPSLPVDMSWSRRIKQDLFVQHSPNTSIHSSLLQEMGKYLAKARKEKHEQPRFDGLVKFQIPSDLCASSGETSSTQTTSTESSTSKDVKYILTAVDIVDVHHYSIPTARDSTVLGSKGGKKKAVVQSEEPPLWLRYTTFFDQMYIDETKDASNDQAPSSKTSSRDRHELSIVEVPLLAAVASKSPTTDHYWQATIAVAEHIAELGRNLKIR